MRGLYTATLWDQLRATERPSDEARRIAVDVLDDWLVTSLNQLTPDNSEGEVSVFRLSLVAPRLSAEGVSLVRQAFGLDMAGALRQIKHYADAFLASDNKVLRTQWCQCPAHGMELVIVRK